MDIKTNIIGLCLVLIVSGLMFWCGYCLGKLIESFGKDVLSIDGNQKKVGNNERILQKL